MHRWEDKPVLLLALATGAILVGTMVTMALPFVWVNTEKDRIEAVTPYTPLQLAGRDVYIREGCNNCHTQTVRPLVADVKRYGPPSKSGEFVYDQPFLWGSRRTGPDLAREGGKYPDSWQHHHLEAPASLVPSSNMPAYAFLKNDLVDPPLTKRKMDALGFPYTDADLRAVAGKTDMDALVAYLQKLGSDVGWRKAAAAATPASAEQTNPYEANPGAVLAEGENLYAAACGSCHKDDGSGVGPALTGLEARDAAELFRDIVNGIPDGGMPAFATLGSDRAWKIVTYLRQAKK